MRRPSAPASAAKAGRASGPARPARTTRKKKKTEGSDGRSGPPTVTGKVPPPLVLVVDDFPDNREMYVQYLSFSGYRVAEAEDGEDALAKAAALVPDVVVMDLALPRLDGWEATRRLKKDAAIRHIPVIALTGHGLPEHVEKARQAGCDAFLTKPCTPADLACEIRRLLAAAAKTTSRKGG